MAKIDSVPSACPECSGPIWDNTTKPKRNPRAPDAACKDRDGCGWAGWLPKQSAPSGPRGAAPRHTYTWPELGNTYAKSVAIAKRVWGDKVPPEAQVAAAATVFIQAVQSGLKVEPEAE